MSSAGPADPPGPVGVRRPRARRGSPGSGGPDGTETAPADTDAADSEPADPETVARLICLQMLTAAPRTRAQLADALRRRGVPDEAAQAVLTRFADVQLIDDAMFAQAWVDSRHHGRGLARRALAAELRQRGVASEDIQDAVDRLDPEQERATARALVDRRLVGMRGVAAPARFRRLMGMLARKGYSQGLAYQVVRAALESEPTGTDLSDLAESEPDDELGQW